MSNSHNEMNPSIPTPSPDPRPKSLALTVLVDWSNQDKADATGIAGIKSSKNRKKNVFSNCYFSDIKFLNFNIILIDFGKYIVLN